MKPSLLLVFIFSCIIGAHADTLIKRNGDEITCKIVRITPTILTYCLQDQSVEREISVNDVFMVKYDNGTTEKFNTGDSSTNIQNSGGPTSLKYSEFFPMKLPFVFNTDYSDLEPSKRKYNKWDLYDENGIRGIVVEVTDDGHHGKIISLPTGNFNYSAAYPSLPSDFMFGADDFIDGEYNTRMLRQSAMEAGFTGDKYPKLLKWLDDLGPGWYIPSYGELAKLNYDFQFDNGGVGHKAFLNAIKLAGGVPIKKNKRFMTSTEVRRINTLNYTFALIAFCKDTYSNNMDDVSIAWPSRRYGNYKAYHRF